MNKPFIILLLCLLVTSFLRGTFSAEKKHQNEIVIATVNGKKITQQDITNRLETFGNTDAETFNTIKQEILDQLITDILLEEFIDKQGLIVTAEEIAREVNQIRSNITSNQKDSGQSLEKVLAAIGSNIGEFKRSIKHSLALGKYFNNKIDDKTLEKYFDGNKSLFNGEPVQTEFGYHLIKVTEKKEGANIKFGDVKEKVRVAVLEEETLKLLSQLHKA